MLEILLQILPRDSLFIKMLDLLQLVPPHGNFPLKMVNGNPCFKVG
jgi:hypothetical protein